MQCTEARFVAEQRSAGHGHATGEQGFNPSIQPNDRDCLGLQKFGSARLGVGAAAERQHGRFAKLQSAAQCGAKLRGFQQTKRWFAVALEKFADLEAGGVLNSVVEVDKAPSKLARQLLAYGGFSGAHEAGECHDRDGKRTSHAKSLVESAAGRKATWEEVKHSSRKEQTSGVSFSLCSLAKVSRHSLTRNA